MAIITKMPSLGVIAGFKGVVDFYIHDGQNCARTWPRSPGKNRSPEVTAQWPRFAYAVKLWREATPIVREAYQALPPPVGLSSRDLFIRAYISGIFRYTSQNPP